MKISIRRENSDGLDAVFDAYRCLKDIFDAAEVLEVDQGERGVDVLLRLPGSGEIVDPNDANVLNLLEAWLIKQAVKPEVDE